MHSFSNFRSINQRLCEQMRISPFQWEMPLCYEDTDNFREIAICHLGITNWVEYVYVMILVVPFFKTQ